MDKIVPAGAAILLDFIHQADIGGAVAGRRVPPAPVAMAVVARGVEPV